MTREVLDTYHNHRDPRIIYLVVTSWGGMHLYAMLHQYADGPGKYGVGFTINKTDVEHLITKASARQLNREDPSYRHMVGEKHQKFWDKESAIAAGLEQFEHDFDPETHVLIEATPGDLDPCKILHGPEPWMTELNAMHKAYEAHGYDKDIAQRYETLMLEMFPAIDYEAGTD